MTRSAAKIALLLVAPAVLALQAHAERLVPDWSVNPAEYTYDGAIIAAVYLDVQDVGDEGDLLAAFVGEECRGVITATQTPLSTYLFMLTVYGNSSSGDMLTFQYYDESTDLVYDVEDSVGFVPDMIIGLPHAPFVMHLVQSGDVDDGSFGQQTFPFAGVLSASPNPLVGEGRIAFRLPAPGLARLDVLDLRGRAVRTLANEWFAAGEHQTTWDGHEGSGRAASPGVYYLRLRRGSTQETFRIVRIN
ncbi:FlgD immunoglobulin-like domain containing protein [Candidatus Eisenbacteria bacterium]|uniref:FlgD immunoglobulin-like domain containing protein n=1 Tax=Eiseniibacteriota bacterium TaxID=2212470 RepID=A0ABV6YJR3_UNCEI